MYLVKKLLMNHGKKCMENRVEELDLYKEYKHAYDKATELEFFDKQQEADYYYEYAQQLKKKIDNGETILYKVNF
jgi:type III secretory pathway component EscR